MVSGSYCPPYARPGREAGVRSVGTFHMTEHSGARGQLLATRLDVFYVLKLPQKSLGVAKVDYAVMTTVVSIANIIGLGVALLLILAAPLK